MRTKSGATNDPDEPVEPAQSTDVDQFVKKGSELVEKKLDEKNKPDKKKA